MRKTGLIAALFSALALIPFAGVAAADSPNGAGGPNFGCRDGWTPGAAASADAIKRDRNSDSIVCAKFVNGVGNGDYLQPNAVVTDNNNP